MTFLLVTCCHLLKPYVTFIINLFITRHFTELKAKEKGAKALFTFLPFFLFTFINSLVACLQSSAATSLLALPAARAYTR